MVKVYYYTMIELIDYQLGRIIDVLRETRQLDNTIIIFMRNHGELLEDHGLIYNLVHVSLIISCPGMFKKNLRSEALVELVGITPTLLEAAGIEIPYYIQGKSLLSLLKERTSPNEHKTQIIFEYNDVLALPDRTHDRTHGSMYFDRRYKIFGCWTYYGSS